MLPPPPQHDPNDTPDVAELKRQLYLAHLKIALLEEKLRLARLRRWGAGAEKLSPEQLTLLEGEPGVSEAEVAAEAERGPLPELAAAAVEGKARLPRPHPGRQELPDSLPRRERVLACPPEEQRCPACGSERVVIGFASKAGLPAALLSCCHSAIARR